MDSEETTDHRVERSADGEHLGVCVVRAVADAKGVSTDDLSVALNDVVDPDALERIFAPRSNGETRRGGEVRFVLAECRVSVEPDRTVVVRPERRA